MIVKLLLSYHIKILKMSYYQHRIFFYLIRVFLKIKSVLKKKSFIYTLYKEYNKTNAYTQRERDGHIMHTTSLRRSLFFPATCFKLVTVIISTSSRFFVFCAFG